MKTKIKKIFFKYPHPQYNFLLFVNGKYFKGTFFIMREL